MECPKCKSAHVVKNGSVNGVRKHLCRTCGFQFTRSTPRGKPYKTRIFAVLLYLSGLSLNRIGHLCGVSAQSILNWVRDFAAECVEKPGDDGKAVLLKPDELLHYLEKKGALAGTGSFWIAFPIAPWIEATENETPESPSE